MAKSATPFLPPSAASPPSPKPASSAYRKTRRGILDGLAFDDAHGAEARDLAGEAGIVDDVHDGVHVLVRLGNLFENAVAGCGAEDDSLLLELLRFGAGVAALLGRGAGHRAARSVADGAEGLGHGALGADQDVACRSHRATDEEGLAGVAVSRGQDGRARRERARGAFAMHE